MKIIFGIEGTRLKDEEIEFFSSVKPSGYIIFKRNIESRNQLQELISNLKQLSSEKLILIDQEGGRVQRYIADGKDRYPSAEYFGRMAENKGIDFAYDKAYETYKELAQELKDLGVTINCGPVADLKITGADDIIGDRSYSSNPDLIVGLCEAFIKAHRYSGIESIVKHIPGHGRAKIDSHKKLPIIEHGLDELILNDFITFRRLANQSLYAMTAHIIIPELDPDFPITLSKKAIKLIRENIGFKGHIFTDCLTMGALNKWSISERVKLSYEAGCEYPIYSSGNLQEMFSIVKDLNPKLLSNLKHLNPNVQATVTNIFNE